MTRVTRLLLPALLVTGCAMTSACAQQERVRSVHDFCLLAKRLSAEPAPTAGADDPGNQYDTDQTFSEVLAHNEVYDRTC